MSFIDAFFDGAAMLDGVVARHVTTLPEVTNVWTAGDAIPIVSLPERDLEVAIRFDVIVDATMRRDRQAADRRALAPIVIGLGPGFTPGSNCHVAIETQWGDGLGAVLRDRSTAAPAGGPPLLGNAGRERFVYAGTAGLWRTPAVTGANVAAGDFVGAIDGTPLHAPIAGALRGLSRDGVRVMTGHNVVEIDPRSTPEIFGLGTRPRAIAHGVCAALALE
jgi:xanthine dehydrogenase accessory factor